MKSASTRLLPCPVCACNEAMYDSEKEHLTCDGCGALLLSLHIRPAEPEPGLAGSFRFVGGLDTRELVLDAPGHSGHIIINLDAWRELPLSASSKGGLLFEVEHYPASGVFSYSRRIGLRSAILWKRPAELEESDLWFYEGGYTGRVAGFPWLESRLDVYGASLFARDYLSRTPVFKKPLSEAW